MAPHLVYLLSLPRSSSNLLIQILNLKEQPNAITAEDQFGYFFMQAWDVREGELKNLDQHAHEISQEHRARMMQSYDSGAKDLEGFLSKSETGSKTVFVKEHVPFLINPATVAAFIHGHQAQEDKGWTVSLAQPNPTQKQQQSSNTSYTTANPTVLPDEFLLTWQPTFLIRHPALSIPSLYGIYKELYPPETDFTTLEAPLKSLSTIHFSRLLFDWYSERASDTADATNKVRPIVLDAGDITNDEKVVAKYSELIGLDPYKVRFSWNPLTEEEKKAIENTEHYAMSQTLIGSSGPVKDKTPQEVDIGAEAKKWSQKFGAEAGRLIEQWVRREMADYEYLRSHRLQV